MHQHRAVRLVIGLALATAVSVTIFAQSQEPAPKPAGLQFRFLGPAVGNRAAAIAGVPGDPSVYYAGAASGGVWKTTDGGENSSRSSTASRCSRSARWPSRRPSPNIVWAGTGEAWAIRDADVMGDGIYKSADAGKTWTHMGLDETGRIGRIIVHPRNPDIVFVCALGRTTGPQQERGVFRTTDGGKHWQRVLFVDENTGCSGLDDGSEGPADALSPACGRWRCTPGPCSAAARAAASTSPATAATTWTQRRGPRPAEVAGRARSTWPSRRPNRKRVYALIQTADQGSLWRSDDGGDVVASVELAARRSSGAPATTSASPCPRRNADEVLHRRQQLLACPTDGGLTSFREDHVGRRQPRHLDRPEELRTGSIMTDDGGDDDQHDSSTERTSCSQLLPIGQMYHVAVDNQVPY